MINDGCEIYYILLFMSVALWWGGRIQKLNGKKIYALLMYGSLWGISAFRGEHVGADTYGYLLAYREIANMEIQGFYTRSFEIGYVLLNKALYFISDNPQMILIVSSFVTIVGFAMFFYKYSPNIYITTVLFIGLYFYTFTFTAVRQWLAVMIICWGMSYLWNGDKAKALGIILLAICFHSTAIVFIVFVIVYPLNTRKIVLLLMAVACLYFVLHFYGLSVLSSVLHFNEKFLMYLGGRYDISTSYGAGVLKIALWWLVGIVMLLMNMVKRANQKISYIFVCEIYAGFFLLMGYDVAIVSRTSLGYMIFICLAIPEIYVLLNKYKKMILEIIIFIGCFAYLTQSLNTDGYWAVYNFADW